MADNVTIPLTGSGDSTAIVATDDIGGGVQIQRMKVAFGVGGTADDVTAANPLPTTIAVLNPLDYDTGGGTVNQGLVGIALPASGGPVGVSVTNPLPVTGTVTTGGLTDTQLRASAVPITGSGTAGTAASGVQTVQGIASMTPVQVSQATAASLNATVVGSGSAGTAASGVVTVQGIASMTPLLEVGNVAHDAVDSGNPVKIGARAISYGANPTAVAAADRTDIYANIAGIPFTLGGHPNVITLLTNYTSAQTNTAVITVSAGTKIVMLSCTFACDKANTVNVTAKAGFATATTPTGAGCYISHPGMAPGGGIREAGMVAGADDEDFRITCTAPTTGSIDVVTKYFTIAS